MLWNVGWPLDGELAVLPTALPEVPRRITEAGSNFMTAWHVLVF